MAGDVSAGDPVSEKKKKKKKRKSEASKSPEPAVFEPASTEEKKKKKAKSEQTAAVPTAEAPVEGTPIVTAEDGNVEEDEEDEVRSHTYSQRGPRVQLNIFRSDLTRSRGYC
jgi:hypothetical protein